MKILVFQHIPVEHPGVFRNFLEEDGIEWDTVEFDQGDSIPVLNKYDALWVMGGPMDVWEENKYPWLALEKAAIREAVEEHAMPFLGICLGHQLLADALGGKVTLMARPEVGIFDIELTPEGKSDLLLRGVSPITKCLQWHGAEVVELPPRTELLAHSPACAVQAMRVGDRAYSLQYHVEITEATVAEWGRIPAYEQALERTLGAGALSRLKKEAKLHLPVFNHDARQLYENFMKLLYKSKNRLVPGASA